MVTDDRALMQLHIDTLFTHEDNGDLLHVNERDGLPAPRLFIGVTGRGVICRFRHDVDLPTRHEIETALHETGRDACRPNVPLDGSPYARILERRARIEHIWSGPAFAFAPGLAKVTGVVRITESNVSLLRQNFPGWIDDVVSCQPMFGVAADGDIVSLCCSVRRIETADEAGVETNPMHRGKGYARLVVTAWAGAVRECGRIPFYSTSWNNDASLSVARQLGLLLIGGDLHIT